MSGMVNYIVFIYGMFNTLDLQYMDWNTTPGSMNSLFSDFFREFWRGILGGVRDYLGQVLGGF